MPQGSSNTSLLSLELQHVVLGLACSLLSDLHLLLCWCVKCQLCLTGVAGPQRRIPQDKRRVLKLFVCISALAQVEIEKIKTERPDIQMRLWPFMFFFFSGSCDCWKGLRKLPASCTATDVRTRKTVLLYPLQDLCLMTH